MIEDSKLAEMKVFAENLESDVAGVTIPGKDMADIADTALKLWKVARAADALLNAGSPAGPNDGAYYASEEDAKKLREALDELKRT